MDEFREKKEILDLRRAFNQTILESTDKLIRASFEPNHSLSTEEIDRLLVTLWWYNLEDEWSAAVLDAAIGGNNLSSISNSALRLKLAAWPLIYEKVRYRVSRDVEFFDSYLLPFWIEHAHLAQIYHHDPYFSSDVQVGYESVDAWIVPDTIDHSELLSNRKFQNILIEKMDRQAIILNRAFAGLDERLDETITLLETELRVEAGY